MATKQTAKVISSFPAKAVHAGSQSISAVHTLSSSISSGDVYQMVKVPVGAVVTDVTLTVLGTTANTFAASIGDGDSTTRYLAATSLSNQGVVRATVGIPYSYSATDTVDVVITGVTSATVAGTLMMTVTYKMDDPLV